MGIGASSSCFDLFVHDEIVKQAIRGSNIKKIVNNFAQLEIFEGWSNRDCSAYLKNRQIFIAKNWCDNGVGRCYTNLRAIDFSDYVHKDGVAMISCSSRYECWLDTYANVILDKETVDESAKDKSGIYRSKSELEMTSEELKLYELGLSETHTNNLRKIFVQTVAMECDGVIKGIEGRKLLYSEAESTKIYQSIIDILNERRY